mgnify:CR=1 FL=1
MPHTPVPWVSRGGLWIAGADGEMVADCVTKFTRGRGLQENEDNAHFIIAAVNAHDELLTALEALLTTEDDPSESCYWCGDLIEGYCARDDCPGVMARDAIARARQS